MADVPSEHDSDHDEAHDESQPKERRSWKFMTAAIVLTIVTAGQGCACTVIESPRP